MADHRYTFKIATEPEEMEQIFRLNHRTFVDEIPQHTERKDGKLIDKFHEENTYVICKLGDEVVGMMSARGKRPFSLDHKLPDLDAHMGPGRKPVEIRLLAVDKEHRGTKVFLGLGMLMFQTQRALGYDSAVISGTTLQQRLYKRIGFKPFGPLVGEEGAQFQPMMLRIEQQMEKMQDFAKILPSDFLAGIQTNLLPGPVTLKENVKQAFSETPISHRGEQFIKDFNGLRQDLAAFVNAQHASLFLGSGTLANEIVAGQILRMGQKGIILNNGEFGTRLVDHAKRFGLDYEVIQKPWGVPFTEEDFAGRDLSDCGWLWAVHCETSTGMLQDLDLLKRVAKAHDLSLCLDAISSIGAVPVDLEGVKFAAGTSGKALQSFSGLAIVFHDELVEPDDRLPRYFDLGKYLASGGIAFTQNSNLIYALKAALQNVKDDPARLQRRRDLGLWLREELKQGGLEPLLPVEQNNPVVLTLALPPHVSSVEVAKTAEAAGFLLSAHSQYLVDKNWVQLCLMGELSQGQIAPVVPVLVDAVFGEQSDRTPRAA